VAERTVEDALCEALDVAKVNAVRDQAAGNPVTAAYWRGWADAMELAIDHLRIYPTRKDH
jgi:hypothetical protein